MARAGGRLPLNSSDPWVFSLELAAANRRCRVRALTDRHGAVRHEISLSSTVPRSESEPPRGTRARPVAGGR